MARPKKYEWWFNEEELAEAQIKAESVGYDTGYEEARLKYQQASVATRKLTPQERVNAAQHELNVATHLLVLENRKSNMVDCENLLQERINFLDANPDKLNIVISGAF